MGTVPDWIVACAAVAAVLFGFIEFGRSNKSSFDAQRPYVVPTLKTKLVGKETRLILELKNIGTTPARNVILEFKSPNPWHHVQEPNYPFLEGQGGIAILPPGDPVEFVLGRLDGKTPLEHFKTGEVLVQVRTQASRKAWRTCDEYRLTMADRRYRLK